MRSLELAGLFNDDPFLELLEPVNPRQEGRAGEPVTASLEGIGVLVGGDETWQALLLTGLALAVLAWLLVMGTEWLRWRSLRKLKAPVQVPRNGAPQDMRFR